MGEFDFFQVVLLRLYWQMLRDVDDVSAVPTNSRQIKGDESKGTEVINNKIG